jgi:hypothetical protein
MRATQVTGALSLNLIVIARLVRATHFPSSENKLGRPDKPGDDGV